MTGFNAQVGGGLYRIQIETNRPEVFKVIQDMARDFVDTEQINKEVVSKRENTTVQDVATKYGQTRRRDEHGDQTD